MHHGGHARHLVGVASAMNQASLNASTCDGAVGLYIRWYLPYEFSSTTLITAGNTNAFDIDPEQTTLITAGNTNAFDIDPEQTTLITAGNTNAFDIDPEQTTLITVGLTSAD